MRLDVWVKHKVSELDGAQLDAAVELAEGWQPPTPWPRSWSTDWSACGPIITREAIALEPDEPYVCSEFHRAAGIQPAAWTAWRWSDPHRRMMRGATPLIAAMRLYVASKFDDEVALP